MSHVILRKEYVKRDWKLRTRPKEKNNGRKILVNSIYRKTEKAIRNPEWKPAPKTRKTPVLETGLGGIELATFTHEAFQDCHMHILATEIYIVLEGKMKMRLNDRQNVLLCAGDELIILPGTVHEVLPEGHRFLTRVHTVNCSGDGDKYVRANCNWCQVLTLKRLDVTNEQ